MDGSIPTQEDFAYDLDGRRTSMTDGTGTTTYQYDSVGRTTSTQDSFGDVIDSDFDLRGDRTSITYPNGHTVTMQYDGNGQMTGETDWLGNTTHFHYDGAGNLTASHVVGGKTTTWTYDAANRNVHYVHQSEDGVTNASFDYTRAADGRITSVHSTGLGDPDHSYSYGIQARLGSYDASPVTFDSRSNVTRLPDGSSLTLRRRRPAHVHARGWPRVDLQLRRRRPADRVVECRLGTELRVERSPAICPRSRQTGRPRRTRTTATGSASAALPAASRGHSSGTVGPKSGTRAWPAVQTK